MPATPYADKFLLSGAFEKVASPAVERAQPIADAAVQLMSMPDVVSHSLDVLESRLQPYLVNAARADKPAPAPPRDIASPLRDSLLNVHQRLVDLAQRIDLLAERVE